MNLTNSIWFSSTLCFLILLETKSKVYPTRTYCRSFSIRMFKLDDRASFPIYSYWWRSCLKFFRILFISFHEQSFRILTTERVAWEYTRTQFRFVLRVDWQSIHNLIKPFIILILCSQKMTKYQNRHLISV